MATSDHTQIELKDILFNNKKSQKSSIPYESHSILDSKGMQLLFLFLVNDIYLNKTTRSLARMTGLPESQVSSTFRQLKRMGALVETDKKIRFANKKKLLDLWIINYGRLLRAKLILESYIMKPSIEKTVLQKLASMLPESRYAVGGVLGSDFLIPYNQDIKTQIYIKAEDLKLVEKELELIPSKESNIILFHLFSPDVIFHDTFSKIPVAQPLLIYAEMLHNRQIRAEETMRIIYDQYLENPH